jgi:hypothetical protein
VRRQQQVGTSGLRRMTRPQDKIKESA